MKQDEEDDVQFEQQQQADAAARAFEAARQSRVAVEEKCFLGLINAVKETAA